MTDGDQHDARTESITDLIVLGRDREAVAAATRTSNQGGPMDGVQQLDEIIPLIEDGGRADQARPARQPDGVRQLHGDGRPRAHDRWRHPLLAAFRGEAAGSAAPARRGRSPIGGAGHGRALERAALAGRSGADGHRPLRRGAGRSVRPLHRVRRPRPRLGSVHAPPACPTTRPTTSSPRSTPSLASSCSRRCATATRSPPRPRPRRTPAVSSGSWPSAAARSSPPTRTETAQ